MHIQEGIAILLVLVGVASPIVIISAVYYLKKRLEHQQIMAAVEKGTPLPELVGPAIRPAGPAWIKYLSLGIAMLIIALGFMVTYRRAGLETVIAFVLCGAGVAWVVRGLLYRKYQLQGKA